MTAEQQEILEGNKIIAIFDGCEFVNDAPEDFPNGYYMPHLHTPEELEYHESWDWIMPVVEKIARSGNYCLKEHQSNTISNRGYAYHISISNNVFMEVNEPFIDITSNYDKSESKLSTYFRFCVQFIRWYNKQTTNV